VNVLLAVKLLPESLRNIGVKMYELKCSALCKRRAIPTLFITKMSVKEAPKGCIQRIVRIVRSEAVKYQNNCW
jgi:hypothetical protein